jgi:hypothetical protein
MSAEVVEDGDTLDHVDTKKEEGCDKEEEDEETQQIQGDQADEGIHIVEVDSASHTSNGEFIPGK